jgi:hyperosmotically inducible protein
MKSFQTLRVLSAAALFTFALPVFADAGSAINDTVITGKIKSGLVGDSVTHATTIGVETNNGSVTLKGTANSETEATRAVQIAESVKDVKNVDATQLQVKNSTQPMADAYITAKVQGVFLKNNLTSGEKNVPISSVKVETQQGIVFLSGTVENSNQASKMAELAKSVDGVSKVESTLKIK